MRGVYVEYSYSTSGICFVGDAEKQEISFFLMLMEEVSVNIEFGALFELFVVNHPSFNDKAQILWSSLAEVSLSHDFFFLFWYYL